MGHNLLEEGSPRVNGPPVGRVAPPPLPPLVSFSISLLVAVSGSNVVVALALADDAVRCSVCSDSDKGSMRGRVAETVR